MNTEETYAKKLTRKEAAERLGVAVRTLDRWRKENINLDYISYGDRIVYREEDVAAFEERCIVNVVA